MALDTLFLVFLIFSAEFLRNSKRGVTPDDYFRLLQYRYKSKRNICLVS